MIDREHDLSITKIGGSFADQPWQRLLPVASGAGRRSRDHPTSRPATLGVSLPDYINYGDITKIKADALPTSASMSEASLARCLASRASAADLTTPEGLCSLTLLGFSMPKDQSTSYWKTSKDFYQMTMKEFLNLSSPRLLSWGTASNGRCSTQRILASPKQGARHHCRTFWKRMYPPSLSYHRGKFRTS
jgi:hypothetical protein